MKRLLCLLLAVTGAAASAKTTEPDVLLPTTDKMVTGEWIGNFLNASNFSVQTGIPMVMVWSGEGCHFCNYLKTALLTDDFLLWQRESGLVFCSVEGTSKGADKGENAGSGAAKFAGSSKYGKVSGFPYVAVYWETGGETIHVNFTGRKDTMLKNYAVTDDDIAGLRRGFIESVEQVLDDYFNGNLGEFCVSGAAGDRLEMEPTTKWVDVPLRRRQAWTDQSAVNWLVADFGGTRVTNRVDWSVGQDEAVVRMAVPGAFACASGRTVALRLFTEQFAGSKASAIHCVAAQPNRVRNPAYVGERTVETLGFGEITYDYDTATQKVNAVRAAGGAAYNLALWSGVLWCPYCQAMEETFFEVEGDGGAETPFADWARSRNVAVTLFEQGRAKASDADPTCGRDCPRLLSYIPDPNKGGAEAVSGASYLSRHGIVPADAQFVKERTANFSTNLWLTPGTTSVRMSQPTLLLIGDRNQVVGRLASYRTGDNVYVPEENVGRLNDLLLLADREDESSDYAETTRLVHTVDGNSTSALQINDKADFYRLDGLKAGRVTLSLDAATPYPVTLAYLRDGQTVAAATGEPLVLDVGAADLEATDVKLKISSFAQSGLYFTNGVTSTAFDAGFSSDYEARPGVIAFDGTAGRVLESAKTATVSVVRRDGATGAQSVKMKLDPASTAEAGVRFVWPADRVLTWAEGETGAKKVAIELLETRSVFEGEEVARFTLEPVSATAEVSATPYELTIFDTDKPCFEGDDLALEAVGEFAAGETLKLYNVSAGTKVTLNRVSGTLPEGLALVYDASTQTVRFEGTATEPGEYEAVYTVTEVRKDGAATGNPTTFAVTVADPKKLNPFYRRVLDAVVDLRTAEGPGRIAGQLAFAAAADGTVCARLRGVSGTTGFDSCRWARMEADGTARAAWTADGTAVEVTLSASGELSATAGELLGTADLSRTLDDAAYAGVYNVTLPVRDGSFGTGYLRFNFTSAGAFAGDYVRYEGRLPDGRELAGAAKLVPDAVRPDGYARLTIFEPTGDGLFAATFRFRKNAADLRLDDTQLRTVLAPEDVTPLWISNGVEVPFDIYGSWYERQVSAADWLERFDLGRGVSLRIGESDTSAVIGAAGDSFRIAEREGAVSFVWSKAAGTFAGTAAVTLQDGRTVSGTYGGLLLPGWIDCGCGLAEPIGDGVAPDGASYIERPFGSGLFQYADFADGRTVIRTLPVDLIADDPTFELPTEDRLSFDCTGLLDELEPNVQMAPMTQFVESVTKPTLTLKGQPSGVTVSKAAPYVLTGKPTKPGVYSVTVTGKNAGKYQYSQTFAASVADTVGERVFGRGEEHLVLGEDYSADVAALFAIKADADGELPTLAVSGLPTGVKFNKSARTVEGKPTKAGTFTATLTATYATTAGGVKKSTKETATMRFVVTSATPDADVNLDALGGFAVGQEVPEGLVLLGRGDTKARTGVTKVSGLPTGLSAKVVKDGTTNVYYVAGTPSKAGTFTVTVTVGVLGANKRVTSTTFTKQVDVLDAESICLTVTDAEGDQSRGKATGGGVVRPGAKVNLRATANRNFVFAGWYDAAGKPISANGDSRVANQSFVLTTDLPTTWFARFASPSEDAVVSFSEGLDGAVFEGDAKKPFETGFEVMSVSAPKVTAKGLPTGFELAAKDGAYVVSYDPASLRKLPMPGVYPVTVTAVNLSKASKTATFTIKLANWTDPRINVPDSLGAFKPGAEVSIDLSQAVDFAGGVTLDVAGLPKGLTYNKTTHRISGAAKVQDVNATVTFTAKISKTETAQATATLTILPYPELKVALDPTAAVVGCKVTGAGKYAVGSKVTLKATAAKGFVFAGWSGIPDLDPMQALNPSLPIVTGEEDLEIEALFMPISEDWLFVEESEDLVFKVNVPIAESPDILPLVTSGSLPTLAMSGLPSGVKFDAKTGLLSGKPTKSGVSYIVLTAKNAGGYSYVRVIRAVVLNADGSEPEEPVEPDDAEIGLEVLDQARLTTGVFYDPLELALNIPEQSETGSPVKKVTAKGFPTGLSVTADTDEFGDWNLFIGGIPSAAGRFKAEVSVTYANNKTAKSVHTLTVLDGGSRYIEVVSAEPGLGTVTGSGVYSVGSTMKFTAKAANRNTVFAGWYEVFDDEGVETELPLTENVNYSCVEYRAATVSLQLLYDSFPLNKVRGHFVPTANDAEIDITLQNEIEGTDTVWDIQNLNEDESFLFEVWSASLPKMTVKGLPKGVTFDGVGGLGIQKFLDYSSENAAKVAPGIYPVTITAVNQTKASASKSLTIRIPNKESEYLQGLDPSFDAYPLQVGLQLDDSIISMFVEDGFTVTTKGQPAGLSLVADKNDDGDITGYHFTGMPTKTGVYTLTLTVKGKDWAGFNVTDTATITVTVSALPEWAVGTFDGFVEYQGFDETTCGAASLTVAANGKISGKCTIGDASVSLSAPFFDSYEEGIGYLATATGKVGGKNRTFGIVIAEEMFSDAQGAETESVIGRMSVYCFEADDEGGTLSGDLVQNVWKRADLKDSVPMFKSGFPVQIGDLTLTIKANGVMTLAGKCEGVSVSGSSQLLWGAGAVEESNARAVIAIPAKTGLPDGVFLIPNFVVTCDDQNVVSGVDVCNSAVEMP